jgi:hypothetical protein
MTGQVARMEGNQNACSVLVGMSEGRMSLGRSRRSWEDNITMDLGKIGWNVMD